MDVIQGYDWDKAILAALQMDRFSGAGFVADVFSGNESGNGGFLVSGTGIFTNADIAVADSGGVVAGWIFGDSGFSVGQFGPGEAF